MESVEEIIIDIDFVKKHKKDFLVNLILHKHCGCKVDWNTSTYRCEKVKCLTNRELSDLTGLCIETVRKYTAAIDPVYEYAGSFALIPISTYNRLLAETANLTAAEKNGIIRVFCYFVCMCWSFQDFSRSVDLITVDLDSKVDIVSRRINFLVQHKFIYIKRYQINFANQDKHPRIYQLYIDEIPSGYVHTEWWRFNVAARESQSIDDILQNFKNSF